MTCLHHARLPDSHAATRRSPACRNTALSFATLLALLSAPVLLPMLVPAARAAGTPAAPPTLPGKPDSSQAASALQGPTSKARKPTTTLYWYDGERRRELVVDDQQVATFGGPGTPAVVAADSIAAKAAGRAASSPVFVDPSSGRLAGAMPGGVLVQTAQMLSEEQAQDMAQTFSTTLVRAIGDSGMLWLFAADTGMPSLKLANRIHESGLVKSASPDWWKPRQKK